MIQPTSKVISKVIAQEMVDAAIAAAAQIFNAEVLDVRRGARLHPASRARVVAVAGLAAAFPGVPTIRIARQFGYAASGKAIYEKLTLSRQAKWWRGDAVDRVAAAVTRAALDASASTAAQAIPAPALRRSCVGPVRPAPTPALRRWRVARIAPPPRPRVVTPVLLGDPPKGRRELLETLPSPDYGRSNGRWA